LSETGASIVELDSTKALGLLPGVKFLELVLYIIFITYEGGERIPGSERGNGGRGPGIRRGSEERRRGKEDPSH